MHICSGIKCRTVNCLHWRKRGFVISKFPNVFSCILCGAHIFVEMVCPPRSRQRESDVRCLSDWNLGKCLNSGGGSLERQRQIQTHSHIHTHPHTSTNTNANGKASTPANAKTPIHTQHCIVCSAFCIYMHIGVFPISRQFMFMTAH